MKHRHRARRHVRPAPVIAGAVASACCLALSVLPATPALAQTGPVSPTPVAGTPTLVPTGSTEWVNQLVQCGNTMYAVGTFTSISGYNGSTTTTVPVNNIFSFSATAPFQLTGWYPDVNGSVNSIAFNDGNCADAYIGGKFTSVNGTAVENIAEIDTSTGDVVPGFDDHTGGGYVDTVLVVNNHVLVGGTFTSINDNKGVDPYYASLNPTTGKDDGFLHLNVSGHYVYHAVRNNSTEVFNQQLSPDGTLLLAEGDFTSVGGLPRQQIFMLNVTGATATVTGWSSPAWDGSDPSGTEFPNSSQYDPYWQCGDSHPFYIQAAAWSPDESTIYIADTGLKPINWSGSFPLVGICDSISAVPAMQQEVEPAWTNYDGCNSMYSVAADQYAVYVGGHERWANDPDGCKKAGPGFVVAQGLGGFTPGLSGGSLIRNPAGTAGLYNRSRGHGADDMLLTSAGLWVASDNFGGDTSCGGQAGYSGICFLPYPS
jgi:hypothetical protein